MPPSANLEGAPAASPPAAPGPSTRRLTELLIGVSAVSFALLGLARYRTFHNQTFDLAFYSRIAWGLVHQDFWEPMVNAHVYGLHLSPVLVPLGALGALTDTPSVLLIAQGLALAGAAVPLARVGVRHLGPVGMLVGAAAWLFYPNIGHVAGYEFHPGSLAVLPLAFMAFAIDAGRARVFAWSALGVLACREDLALVTLSAAALFALRHRGAWRSAAVVGAGSMAYALFFFFVVHPAYAPEQGSLELHFGRFGDSAGAVVFYLLTHPGELLAHLATPERLLYLPKILAPLALLPLLRPSWLLAAAPVLAINLISEWPTTTDLDVHYLTPALPFLVAGALDGAGRVRARWPEIAPAISPLLVLVPVLVGHAIAGGTPLSSDFVSGAFTPDDSARQAAEIVARVPATASVQAPYGLLAHFAERGTLHRASSPEANDDFYVLDVSHRIRFAGSGDLLRTVEEPVARDWLARGDHGLRFAGARYLLLERGLSPREGLGGRAIVGRAEPTTGQPIAGCLSVRSARVAGDTLVLRFVARAPCPSDLALRIGVTNRPSRVDLLFDGWLSPAQIARGDLLESTHRLTPALRDAIRARGLRVGTVRQSGARPEPTDPDSVAVELSSDI